MELEFSRPETSLQSTLESQAASERVQGELPELNGSAVEDSIPAETSRLSKSYNLSQDGIPSISRSNLCIQGASTERPPSNRTHLFDLPERDTEDLFWRMVDRAKDFGL
jgi:hypothetical protein